ncbi:cell division protein ZapA, partial [Clostridium chrysemydis]
MKKITVNINGVDYNLRGEGNEDYLREISSYVDGKLKEIGSKNNMLSVSQAAVLTAVNITDELYKTDDALRELAKNRNNLEKEKKTLYKTIDGLKENLDEVKKETEKEKLGFESVISGLKKDREELLKEKNTFIKDSENLKLNLSTKNKEVNNLKEEIKKVLKDLNNLKIEK